MRRMPFLFLFLSLCFGGSFGIAEVHCDRPLKAASPTPQRSKIRDDFSGYANQVRANQPKEVVDWENQTQIHHAYVKTLLERLNSKLTKTVESSKAPTHASVLESAKMLVRYTAKLLETFDQSGILYHDFLKLNLLYATQFELLTPLYRIDNSFVEQNLYVESKDSVFSPISPILTSYEQIQNFLKQNAFQFFSAKYDLHLNIKNPSHSIDFRNLRIAHPMIVVPTTANLGFETILWSQSRGLALLGLTDVEQKVDGRKYRPLPFFIHDFLHNMLFQNVASSNNPEFWDELSKNIHLESSERTRKILMAHAFLAFHENTFAMSCGPGGAMDWARGGADSRLDTLRLQSPSDLGLAFGEQVPTFQESIAAVGRLRQLISQLCKK